MHIGSLSGPIIEDCDALRIGPHRHAYPELAQDTHNAGLDAARSGTQWRDVKDFKWLRTTPSPHFVLLDDL